MLGFTDFLQSCADFNGVSYISGYAHFFSLALWVRMFLTGLAEFGVVCSASCVLLIQVAFKLGVLSVCTQSAMSSPDVFIFEGPARLGV